MRYVHLQWSTFIEVVGRHFGLLQREVGHHVDIVNRLQLSADDARQEDVIDPEEWRLKGSPIHLANDVTCHEHRQPGAVLREVRTARELGILDAPLHALGRVAQDRHAVRLPERTHDEAAVVGDDGRLRHSHPLEDVDEGVVVCLQHELRVVAVIHDPLDGEDGLQG